MSSICRITLHGFKLLPVAMQSVKNTITITGNTPPETHLKE